MALVNPYCTVAQVRAEIRNDDVEVLTQVEDAINQASRWIDQYRGRDYYQHDYSSTALSLDAFDNWDFGDTLFLPYRPIIELTEVKVDGITWTSGTDFLAKAPGKLISLRGDWITGNPPSCTLTIKGKFGYAQAASTDVPTGIPGHISRACILVAAAFSGLNRKDVIGVDGSATEVITKEVPRVAYDLLGKHRIFS